MPKQTLVKIPFWKTVGYAYKILFQNFHEFIRLSWILMIITYGISFGIAYYAARAQMPHIIKSAWIVQTVCLSVFAVAWHRLVLLRERHQGAWFFIKFGKREFVFVLISILVTMLMYGGSFVIGSGLTAITGSQNSTTPLWSFACLVLLGILGSRFALVYPRISIDKNIGFSESWSMCKGNTLRLYFGNLLVLSPLMIISSILSKIAFSYGQIPGQLAAAVVVEFVGLVCLFGAIGMGAGFVSLSYRLLDTPPGDANSDPSEE
jgi:hypothetical protein